MNGVLLIDKPAGPTSHDVVQHVRRAAHIRKVGHTGTLDPAATGLLILCLGRATRLSEFVAGMDKVYEGILRLGVVTSSHDLQGQVLEERRVPALSYDDLNGAFAAFTGQILQQPPMVSAVKIDGERLYKRARRGQEVERPARPVTVHEFSLKSFNGRDASFRLVCSSGTYARVLCFEVGERLGCGGTLAELRRLSVGNHSVEAAVTLEDLDSPDAVRRRLLPVENVLSLPRVEMQEGARGLIRHGRSFGRESLAGDCPVCDGWVQVIAPSGELLALAEVFLDTQGLRIQPRRVLCDE
ncbi:MAG TPA: tRNA pseudouridine(55) synthase TruB [Candidatus Hydrogenedentes bacterium]|nr:tRNA pseudouridine(55) synthase TruB [Candidatus Hydrogenedentota bacterium]HQM49129.1 tRNA pseudouridine(55) synthase TruB [Candidatus Hydrogenedentota bacterium]